MSIVSAVNFACQGDQLFGILTMPDDAAHAQKRGVLFIVGGPQTRTGSHRQFTLLARGLAQHGTPVFQFDYRGMGDSEGEARDFNQIHDDIRAAIDAFFLHLPALQEVVLWGLCDAASAATFYAQHDRRVTGLVLINPWVRTEAGIAKTYLKHYYLSRLLEIDFWKKITTGRLAIRDTLKSLLSQIAHAHLGKLIPSAQSAPSADLPHRMLAGLQNFMGSILIVLSSKDLTAQEFANLIHTSADWKKLMRSQRIQQQTLTGANHTFSQQVWRTQVLAWTKDWLDSW